MSPVEIGAAGRWPLEYPDALGVQLYPPSSKWQGSESDMKR